MKFFTIRLREMSPASLKGLVKASSEEREMIVLSRSKKAALLLTYGSVTITTWYAYFTFSQKGWASARASYRRYR